MRVMPSIVRAFSVSQSVRIERADARRRGACVLDRVISRARAPCSELMLLTTAGRAPEHTRRAAGRVCCRARVLPSAFVVARALCRMSALPSACCVAARSATAHQRVISIASERVIERTVVLSCHVDRIITRALGNHSDRPVELITCLQSRTTRHMCFPTPC